MGVEGGFGKGCFSGGEVSGFILYLFINFLVYFGGGDRSLIWD